MMVHVDFVWNFGCQKHKELKSQLMVHVKDVGQNEYLI